MAAVNYFEIGSPDPKSARRFYGSLFEWNFDDPDQGYQLINTGQGGVWDTSSVGGAQWAIFYVQVDDVLAMISRAEALGATVALPFVDGARPAVRPPDRPARQSLRPMAAKAIEAYSPAR